MANHENINTAQWDNFFLSDNDESGPSITKSSYYNIDEFNELSAKFKHDTNISILNINARSLIKHFNELNGILNEFSVSFDVINVVETWLNEDLQSLVNLDGYTLITKHKNS